MITQTQLEQLRQSRPQPNQAVHYRPGGAIETQVHSTLDAERIGQLNRGDRIMQNTLTNFKNNMAFKSREGLARGQFKAVNKNVPTNRSDQQPMKHAQIKRER